MPRSNAVRSDDDRNSARINLRTRPHIKQLIRRAAELSGVDDTAFIVQAAYDSALRTIERHERIVLRGEDAAAVLDAIDKPPEPTEALKRAFERYSANVISR